MGKKLTTSSSDLLNKSQGNWLIFYEYVTVITRNHTCWL